MQVALQFRFAGREARFERLALGRFAGQLFAQGGFRALGLGQHRGNFSVVVLQLGLQGNDFSLAFGGALLERALLGFGVVQAQAQRVALGVQVPGALHQLPDTGSELV